MSIEEAFNTICEDVRIPGEWYVCLMERVPFYGGPEEGGWWGSDTVVVAYQAFPSEELAREAEKKIKELANKLEAEARREFGNQCLREMDWLDARGLDADYLREPDGPSEYYVLVSETLPIGSRGCRQYS